MKPTMMRFMISLCLLLGGIEIVAAQEPATSSKALPNFSELFSEESQNTKSKWGVKTADNEIQLLFSNLFVAYKTFLSSQDNAQCNFHPSCSVFAIHAIQKKGPLLGILSAFDRLSRCTGLNSQDYLKNPKNQLLDDPVF